MSQERFDHSVKKKLESVQPPFKEEAWQKFRHLLPLPWYLFFLKKYGGWLYGGLSTAALVGTSFMFLQERSKNQQLQQRLAAVQTTTASDLAITTPPFSKSHASESSFKSGTTSIAQKGAATPAKTDTVYLVRKIYVDRAIDANRKDLAEKSSVTVANNHSINRAGQPDYNTSFLPQNAPTNSLAPQKEPTPFAKATPALGASTAITQDTAKNTRSSERIGTQTSASAENTESGLARKDTTRHLNQPDTLAAAVLTQKPAGSTFALPSLHTRFGIAADAVGFQRLAFGPTAELFLGERLSVAAGLQFSSSITERLGDSKEFNRRKGRRFEDEFRDRIPRNDRIEEIELSTKLVRLPISLQYYFPTNGNLSFMVMGGTNLDISVRQQVDFQSSLQGQRQYNRFERKPTPNTFNNVLYGVGLQYGFGKWMGQLMPYYNYQLSEPDYRDTTPKVGISATIKIDIRK